MKEKEMSEILSSLHHNHIKVSKKNMKAFFLEDSERFSRFSIQKDDFLMDWSKCCVDSETMTLLSTLVDVAGLSEKRESMFSGESINTTENRPVLHTALRNLKGEGLYPSDPEIKLQVCKTLMKMEKFSDDVRLKKIRGASGKEITDVVNIGIGGSDLGSVMAIHALAPYHDGPCIHHVSNIDGAHIHDTLIHLNPETTFFILSSKSFSTIETKVNAETAQSWIEKSLGKAGVRNHFFAVSAHVEKAMKFGIDRDSIFTFQDWVGGRYSIWSSVGLPLMIAIGKENFRSFLEGAREMDLHFLSQPNLKNAPVVLGLLGYWHRVICQYPSRAVIPYDQRLAYLPAYLQQLDMESNGKSVTQNGMFSLRPTGSLVWGATGTNAQHAFFQFLHQGTDSVPVEFLVSAVGHEEHLQNHHDLLLANCFAQSEALMMGRTEEDITHVMHNQNLPVEEFKTNIPHRVFPGGRPSITLLYEKLNPRTLGQLLALFEHRTFVEGILFDINSFDQWGVELGKELAHDLLPLVESQYLTCTEKKYFSGSTEGLLTKAHALRERRKI